MSATEIPQKSVSGVTNRFIQIIPGFAVRYAIDPLVAWIRNSNPKISATQKY
jgi:hypothetical protein